MLAPGIPETVACRGREAQAGSSGICFASSCITLRIVADAGLQEAIAAPLPCTALAWARRPWVSSPHGRA